MARYLVSNILADRARGKAEQLPVLGEKWTGDLFGHHLRLGIKFSIQIHKHNSVRPSSTAWPERNNRSSYRQADATTR